MGSLELVEAALEPSKQTLGELARTANEEHALALEAGREALLHAIRCGEALLEVRNRIDQDAWLPWIDENFPKTFNVAQTYMRLAEFRHVILDAGAQSVTEGMRLLYAGKFQRHIGRSINTDREDRAKELRGQGVPLPVIAGILDVHESTVRAYIDPAFRDRKRRQTRETARRRRAAQKVLREREREQAIKAAVRKKGGAVAEAYAMVSKLDQVLGQARQEATDKDDRLAINEAHALRDKMMDALVRTLGVS